MFGVDVMVHWTFLIFAVIEIMRSPVPVQYSLLWLALLFCTVLVHEFGHIFMGRRFGAAGNRILLWPLGGLAFVGHRKSAKEDFWIAFGGPLTHIPMGLIAALLLTWLGAGFHFEPSLYRPVVADFHPADMGQFALLWFFEINVMFFCFNVFTPAFPMDGGQMLVALLLPRFGAERTSLVAIVLSCGFGFFMLLGGGFGQMVGMMLLFEAVQLYQLRQAGMIRSHPSFAHYVPVRTQPRDVPQMPKVIPLRPSGKKCPKCSRPLPDSAQMCGFCEIRV